MTWYYDGKTDGQQILSSRIRLARNIRKYPFRQMLSKEESRKMIGDAMSAVKNDRNPLDKFYHSINISDFNETEQRVFLEKHIISPEFLKDSQPRGLLLKDDENVSIMLNEEDHIRIQTIVAGDGIGEAFEMAGRIDDLIEESVEYAFDKDYGFLTSCPTNTGTGLRASFMIHLPIIERTGQFKNLLTAVNKFGITIRGLHGEGTESMGAVYQISSQITLGKSESDIIANLQNVTRFVISQEKAVFEKILGQQRLDVENRVYRAYGTLAYCRRISAKEAMDLLSDVRLGYISGLLAISKPSKPIYQIMIEIQPGHLQRIAGRELSEEERDAARASYLRSIFN